ncbi:hypothetical protein DITRI_Ditri20bG0007600 [Diplodiscus trichospermus]
MFFLKSYFFSIYKQSNIGLLLLFFRSSLNQIEASRGKSLQLRFVSKLPPNIFTGSKVEDEDGNPIRIILVDATSQTMVSSGSLSSIKVEIVALNGDFGADERDDWTVDQFNASVLREREGKRPLVTGDLYVTLVDGVGSVDNVIFTDNSSWSRSRKFRLGARVVQRSSGEVTVREARSEAFVVKDHRGELYKKHHPPFMHDDVWRLEKIAKKGVFHKQLASHKILTVKDFLRLHVTDPSALRNIRGGRISNREWDAIIKHALSCVLDDDELYTYNVGATQKVGILLNSIYQVVAATFDGQNYQPVEQLTFSQKVLVEDAKKQAYNNVHNLVLTNQRAIMSPSVPLTNMLPEPHSIPSLLLQQPDFSVSNQDEPGPSKRFNQCSTSNGYEMEDADKLQVSPPQDEHAIQAFNTMLRNCSFEMGEIFPYNGDNSLSLLPDIHFTTDIDNSEAQMPLWNSPAPAWGQGNGFIFPPDSDPSVAILSSSPNFDVHSRRMGEARDVCPKAGWLKLRAVIQWRSIRRGAARRRPWLPEGLCM